MMILLPLVALALAPTPSVLEAGAPAVASSPRGAQVRLAELIGEADSIHAISVRRAKASSRSRPTAVEVSLDRDGVGYRVVATVNPRGEVTSLTVVEASPVEALGSLSWLSREIANANAITRVAVDEDDAITLVTDANDAFMIIPGRGSGGAATGNEASAARWAAAWDSTDA